MSRSTRVVEAKVTVIRSINSAGTWIGLLVPEDFALPLAGQFVEVACSPEAVFRLNRPFSVSSWQEVAGGFELGILFATVGDGSRWLATRVRGDVVRIIGPLGRPFRPLPDRRPILIAGGRGIAPLLLLASQMAERLPAGRLLYGARDNSALFPIQASPYPVECATLDGSYGEKGDVIDLLGRLEEGKELSPESVSLYACGPMGMLAAVSRYAMERGLNVQVSLETSFGCGTGLCSGCAVPIRSMAGGSRERFERYAFACCDGPVFDGERIDWDEVRE